MSPATNPKAPLTLSLDSNTLVLRPGSEIKRGPYSILGNDGPVLGRIQHQTPWGVGLRYGDDPHRVWAEENVNSMFKGVLTRGPQKQVVTIAAAILGNDLQWTRFKELRNELYAMRRRETLLAGQTVTKLYFHNATDDRSISTGLPAGLAAGTATVKTMNPTIGASQTSIAVVTGADTASYRMGRFVSPALASQTIGAQNWRLNIARRQATLVATTATAWGLRLFAFRPSTQTVVGYIVGTATADVNYTDASENTVAGSTESFYGTTTPSNFSGAQVVVQSGDVLVCEVTVEDGTGTGDTYTFYYDGATETATDNTVVTDHASYLLAASNLTISGSIPAQVPGSLVYLENSNALTNSSIDTDTGMNYVQGLEGTSERLLALSAFPYSGTGGQAYSCLAQSWDGSTWTNTNLQVQNQFLFVDVADVGGTLYILYSDDVSYPTKWTVAALAANTLTGSTAVGFGTVLASVSSSVIPYRLVAYPNSFAGTEVAWVFTAEGIYENVGSVFVLMHRWNDTGSGYSGRQVESRIVDGVDSLIWNDGDQVWQGYWPPGGGPFLIRRHDPPEPFDGIPEDQQGPVTCIAISEDRGCWVARGQGGADSSHYGGVFIYAHPPHDDGEKTGLATLHRPYENATANRIIRAMAFTRENDGVSKLIIMEDNGTANDVSCFVFTYIQDNPETVAAYPFNAGGNVTFSEAKPLPGIQTVGWMAIGVEGRALSSVKTVSIQDGQNGVTPGGSQTITSATSPPQVYPTIKGTHTGSNNASVLTDSAATFVVSDVKVGDTVYNSTDGSSATITAVTATTITGTLAGGTQNDWDTNDVYHVITTRGVSARSQQVLLTLADSAVTSTRGPTVNEVSETFIAKSMTPDGKATEEYSFVVDLDATSKRGQHAANSKNAWDTLIAIAEKNTLVALVLPGGETVYVTVNPPTVGLEPQAYNPVQQGPASGYASVTCRRLIR